MNLRGDSTPKDTNTFQTSENVRYTNVATKLGITVAVYQSTEDIYLITVNSIVGVSKSFDRRPKKYSMKLKLRVKMFFSK